MGRQWLRQVKVTFSGSGGSLVVTDLKIDFEGTRSIGSKQNSGSVTIYNLAKMNRAKLGKEFDKVELEFGYKGGPSGIILSGNVREVEHKPDGEGADIASAVKFGDGDKGVNQGAVSRTWPRGTKPEQIIRDVVGEMPTLSVGQMVGISELPAITRPMSAFGWGQRTLETLGRQFGFYWSIQNGKVIAMKNDKAFDGPIKLSKSTGMIKVPTVTDKGIKVTALINPEASPGKQIDVESSFLDENSGRSKSTTDQGGGIYRINSISYSGSNRDNDCEMVIEAVRMQGGSVAT